MNFKMYFFSFVAIIFITSASYGQCGDELIERGKDKLSETTFLNDYKVILKKSKKKRPASVSYNIRLQKGNVYRFISETDSTNSSPMIFKITDDLNIYAQSYDPQSGKVLKGFEFLCNKTQNYYLTCYYMNGSRGCGAVLVSKVKSYTNY